MTTAAATTPTIADAIPLAPTPNPAADNRIAGILANAPEPAAEPDGIDLVHPWGADGPACYADVDDIPLAEIKAETVAALVGYHDNGSKLSRTKAAAHDAVRDCMGRKGSRTPSAVSSAALTMIAIVATGYDVVVQPVYPDGTLARPIVRGGRLDGWKDHDNGDKPIGYLPRPLIAPLTAARVAAAIGVSLSAYRTTPLTAIGRIVKWSSDHGGGASFDREGIAGATDRADKVLAHWGTETGGPTIKALVKRGKAIETIGKVGAKLDDETFAHGVARRTMRRTAAEERATSGRKTKGPALL